MVENQPEVDFNMLVVLKRQMHVIFTY